MGDSRSRHLVTIGRSVDGVKGQAPEMAPLDPPTGHLQPPTGLLAGPLGTREEVVGPTHVV